MAASLEHRRIAIAAALRAVMAEPLPVTPIAPAQPTLVATVVEATPTPTPVVETVTFEPDRRSERLDRPTLREALVAEIEWDEPEHAESLDELDSFDRSPDDLSGLEDIDDDWVAPSVPPLEVAGSMSRVASMALFGHA